MQWRGGTLCQVTGALSMLSGEVSVMLLTAITADRLICIVFHFRVQPLSLKMCYLICLVVWLLGFVMSFLPMSDFCCWMPVIIIGILSLSGSFHDPEKKAYVWMAVFVLPFNSSVNPILYTLSTPQMRDWFCKHSKSKEHGKRGVHYLHKPGALFSTAAASNPATKIKTTELSLPSLNVANLERSGCINKGFQDDTLPLENGNRLALVENGSSQDNSSATYDTRL